MRNLHQLLKLPNQCQQIDSNPLSQVLGQICINYYNLRAFSASTRSWEISTQSHYYAAQETAFDSPTYPKPTTTIFISYLLKFSFYGITKPTTHIIHYWMSGSKIIGLSMHCTFCKAYPKICRYKYYCTNRLQTVASKSSQNKIPNTCGAEINGISMSRDWLAVSSYRRKSIQEAHRKLVAGESGRQRVAQLPSAPYGKPVSATGQKNTSSIAKSWLHLSS